MKILITDVRYRMAVAAMRDLSESGHTVCALHFGSGTPPAFSSTSAHERFILNDSAGKERSDAIISLADTVAADVIFPIGAQSLCALAAHCHDDPRLLIPTPDQLDTANDKAAVAALARGCGIAVPAEFSSPEEADRFPVVVKYRNGEALGLHAAQRYAIAENKAELVDIYARMSEKANVGGQLPPLIQQYVRGGGYGVSMAFDRDGKPIAVLGHHRLREYPISGGPSALCETYFDKKMTLDALNLLSAMKWRGIAMAEFRGSPDEGFYLLEVNPRIWGSFPLTRVSDSGFSEKYVLAAAGESNPINITDESPYRTGVKMGFRHSNYAAALAYLRRGNVGRFFSAALDGLRCGRGIADGLLEKGDPALSRAYMKYLLFSREG